MDVIAGMLPWVAFFAACWMSFRSWSAWQMWQTIGSPSRRAKAKLRSQIMIGMTIIMWIAAILLTN